MRGVTNRHPAAGGVDAESVDEARVRGPLMLRTRSRAVTAEDFELLTREAAPEVARVRCIPAPDRGGRRPRDGVHRARRRRDERRAALRGPAAHRGDAGGDRGAARGLRGSSDRSCTSSRRRIRASPSSPACAPRPRPTPSASAADAVAALHRYFDPLVGGPDGKGWPWGRPVQSGDAFGVLQRIAGVDVVEDVRLFGANPVTGERGEATARLELARQQPRVLLRAPGAGWSRHEAERHVSAAIRADDGGCADHAAADPRLPSMYQDGMFLEQFTAGLDVVLAPVIATLDCLDAYVDPRSRRADFVGWLGDWVGLRLDEDWTVERRRRLVAAAAVLFARAARRTGWSTRSSSTRAARRRSTIPAGVDVDAADGRGRARAAGASADRTVRVTVDVTERDRCQLAGAASADPRRRAGPPAGRDRAPRDIHPNASRQAQGCRRRTERNLMIVCTRCGFQNLDNDSFCGSCGGFLEWTGEKVAPPPALPSPRSRPRPSAAC